MKNVYNPASEKQENKIILMACRHLNEWVASMGELTVEQKLAIKEYQEAREIFLAKINTLLVQFFTYQQHKHEGSTD